MGRGFGGCGPDGELDGMACLLDRTLAVIRERRGLDGTSRRVRHGSEDLSVARMQASRKLGRLVPLPLDLAGATGSSTTSGLWTSEAVL